MLTDKLNTFTKQAINTFLRFPLAMLIAIFGTIVAMALVDTSNVRETMLIQILLTTLLGLPLAVSFSLIAGFNKWKLSFKIYAHLAIVALMILFYFHLPNFDLFVAGKYIMRFIFLIICAWLTVFFLPLTMNRKSKIFWNYIYSFFAHLALTVIFTGILYAGLSFVILSVDKLLIEIPRDWHIYERLWIFITGIIAVWFFLSKMPKSIKALDVKKDYPKYLQALSNFILVPVITTYGLILYIYGVRSLITWSVPKGEVIYLFTTFFVFGIIINFIVSPDWFKGRKWLTDKFNKYYFTSVIPLLVLYFVAIGIRLSDYGITEPRYYVVLFGVWLFAMSIYLLIKKRQFIIIPISIFILMLVTLVGPWGSNSVSASHQMKIFKSLLSNNNLIISGKIESVTKKDISVEDSNSGYSIVKYITGRHGTSTLQPLFNTDLATLAKDCTYGYCIYTKIGELLPFKYEYRKFGSYRTNNIKNFDIKRVGSGFDIKGYEYSLLMKEWVYGKKTRSYKLWNESFLMKYDLENSKLKLLKGTELIFDIDFKNIVKSISEDNKQDRIKLPTESLSFVYTNKPYEMKLIFDSIYGEIESNKINRVYFSGAVLVKKDVK